MDCREVKFSGHAVRRMFERGISVEDVLAVIVSGEVISDYPEDAPFPSCLILGFVSTRPIHVVTAREARSGTCYVITTYPPHPAQWSTDFKIRRSP